MMVGEEPDTDELSGVRVQLCHAWSPPQMAEEFPVQFGYLAIIL